MFFNGDLRILLYLSPISFSVFFLSFFNYYLLKELQDSIDYLNKLLTIKNRNSAIRSNRFFENLVAIKRSDFSFSFTIFANEEGYKTEESLKIAANLWFDFGKIYTFFQTYSKISLYFNIGIIVIQVFCWFTIAYKFFVYPMFVEASPSFNPFRRIVIVSA